MQRQDGRDGSSEIGGGAEGDRTPDLRIANATLSQLSYGPMAFVAPLRGAADYGDRATACQAGLPAEPGLGILDAGPCMADGLASNLAALRGWRHAAICIRSSNALRECRARSHAVRRRCRGWRARQARHHQLACQCALCLAARLARVSLCRVER